MILNVTDENKKKEIYDCFVNFFPEIQKHETKHIFSNPSTLKKSSVCLCKLLQDKLVQVFVVLNLIAYYWTFRKPT